MVVRYLKQKIREKHFSSRERQFEKPALGAAAVKGKSEGRGKRNRGDCVPMDNSKVSALEEISVE